PPLVQQGDLLGEGFGHDNVAEQRTAACCAIENSEAVGGAHRARSGPASRSSSTTEQCVACGPAERGSEKGISRAIRSSGAFSRGRSQGVATASAVDPGVVDPEALDPGGGNRVPVARRSMPVAPPSIAGCPAMEMPEKCPGAFSGLF